MKLLFDFSRVILFPKDDSFQSSLNGLYKDKLAQTDFKFFNYFKLNTELLDYLNANKDRFELYIFTSESIQNAPEIEAYIKPLFKKIFSALDIGYGKKDPQSYTEISKLLNSDPSEITFIDDTYENIEAAQKAGLKTIKFDSNSQLFKEAPWMIS